MRSVLFKMAIHHLLKKRLKNEYREFYKTNSQNKLDLIEGLRQSQIALSTEEANEQHYEVPTEFYQLILGSRLKYSSAYFSNHSSLDEAEEAMLRLYCERAKVKDGQAILDLGCGWGSVSLYVAEHYPNARIIAVSNSKTQKDYIDAKAREKGFDNLKVITCDVNRLDLPEGSFDRVISIEMFEHVRNYQQLLSKISSWLTQDGLLFVHHFCHRELCYPFDESESWMAKYFFKDGLMPSEDLLLYFQDDLVLDQRWRVSGEHYAKTCQGWLNRLFQHKKEILGIFTKEYGADAKKRFIYWELFIRACMQLFAFNGGNEWFVNHIVMRKR